MAETTISWTDYTFNPWVGCTKVSAGCAHCYAEALVVDRFKWDVWGPGKPNRRTSAANWRKPLAWNRNAEADGVQRKVFCGSLCDWAEDRPELEAWRADLFAVIDATPYLTWQLLTKRAERLATCVPWATSAAAPSNVWLGVSVESRETSWRARVLSEIPAVVRFVSYEPALGPADDLWLDGIDWVIYGGESGAGYRPDTDDWARDLLARCRDRNIAFWYKQGAAPRPQMKTTLDGQTVHEWPTPSRVYG